MVVGPRGSQIGRVFVFVFVFVCVCVSSSPSHSRLALLCPLSFIVQQTIPRLHTRCEGTSSCPNSHAQTACALHHPAAPISTAERHITCVRTHTHTQCVEHNMSRGEYRNRNNHNHNNPYLNHCPPTKGAVHNAGCARHGLGDHVAV